MAPGLRWTVLTMPTTEDLVLAVLEELEERGAGQAVDPEDAAKIRASLPGCFQDLRERNVILQDIDPQSIPDSQFLHLKTFVAWTNARPFGLAADAGLRSDSNLAEQKLRTLARINRGTRGRLTVDRALTPRRRFWRASC